MEGKMDTLMKMIQDSEARMSREMGSIKLAVDDIKPDIITLQGSVSRLQPEMEQIKATFEAWRPEMEAKVVGLGDAVKDLRRQVDHIAKGVGAGALGRPPSAAPPSMSPSPSSAPSGAHSGQLGLGKEHLTGVVVVTDSPPSLPTPVTGQTTNLSMVPFDPGASATRVPLGNPPPHSDFPKFDGDNPRLWKKACEKYFRLYSVSTEFWVEHATMHFTGNAALWFQSAEDKIGEVTWSELCEIIYTRFDRGQYQMLYRQAFKIRQIGSVSDYIERFDTLMHHMLAYKPDLDPTFFTTRFIDGLHNEIKVVVLIQQPQSLETAVSIALLQEEIRDECYQPSSSSKSVSFVRVNSKALAPLSTVNTSNFKQRVLNPGDDKKGHEQSRQATGSRKFAALMNYRRAMNLCFKCGEKYSPQHQCAATVQLHLVEELLEMLEGPESPDSYTTATEGEDETDQELHALSQQAMGGTENSTCFRLQGVIQGQEVLMLIDSGSTGNFISDSLASLLQGVQPMHSPVRVKVANGEILTGTSLIPNCEWHCQGATFNTTMKVIPLQCYDVILGIDWLKAQSPMEVDWNCKWIAVKQGELKKRLFGVTADTSSCNIISLSDLAIAEEAGGILFILQVSAGEPKKSNEMPREIQLLVQEYADLFTEPKGLPPKRLCDHKIPLLPGATPAKLRPYRYNPMQKTEIENQIKELMKQGILQLSASPFAAPALLVKKKDLSWRLCQDFRHLNAMTVKNKYPLPVIDELLDELSGAKWFTTLDLRAGYHQIRMAEEDIPKTAFQTHHGHFEYKVMPYGLTGAPATFQGVMNTVLAPGLRKFVLVFIDDILIYSPSLQSHVTHLKEVFDLLKQNQLKVKQSKCCFAQPKLAYLGHIISAAGVATDPDKIAPIVKWQSPQNVKQLRSFLGMAGYYRKFVKGYGVISKSLTELLRLLKQKLRSKH
jgi:hypothetical protein